MSVYLIDGIKQYNGGTFALVDSNDVAGGMFHVDSKSEMNAIPQDRYKYGMLCFVSSEDTFYKWVNTTTETNVNGEITVTKQDEWIKWEPEFDINKSMVELDNKTFIEYIHDTATTIATDIVNSDVCNVSDIKYEITDNEDVTNVKEALDKLYDSVFYVNISINSFTASPNSGTFELGYIVESPITLNWTTNKSVLKQTLNNGLTIPSLTDRTATYQNDISSNITFTLNVEDDRNSTSRSISYSFLNGVYYGASNEPNVYNSTFIKSLNKQLSSTSKRTFTTTANDGEYVFYAYPSRMGEVSFKVGGFEGGFNKIGEIDFENSYGFIESYIVYKSTNANLGNITVEVV